MCYAKPGPRCSAHALKTLIAAHEAWGKAHTDTERTTAMKNLKEAEEQYDTTPYGQKDLKNSIHRYDDPDGLYSARLERGIAKRKQMLKSIGTKDSGDIDDNLPTISPNGDKRWYLNGKLHREDDRPAVVSVDGTKEWWVDGKCQRSVSANGDKAWYLNGRLHRDGDKPAYERADGLKEWWVNGERHREGDKPAREWADGAREWWVNGEFINKRYN